jgi:hypothetical protein
MCTFSREIVECSVCGKVFFITVGDIKYGPPDDGPYFCPECRPKKMYIEEAEPEADEPKNQTNFKKHKEGR